VDTLVVVLLVVALLGFLGIFGWYVTRFLGDR
jgi:hypothetical protein